MNSSDRSHPRPPATCVNVIKVKSIADSELRHSQYRLWEELSHWMKAWTGQICLQSSTNFPSLHRFISYMSIFKGSWEELCDCRARVLNVEMHFCHGSRGNAHQLLFLPRQTQRCACVMTYTQLKWAGLVLLEKKTLSEVVGELKNLVARTVARLYR